MQTIFLILALTFTTLSQPSIQIPLSGTYNELFMYYFVVQVGTPPESYTVILDTGSSNFLIPDITCSTCVGNETTFYNASNSHSSLRISCNDPRFECNSCTTDRGQCAFDIGFAGFSEYANLAEDIVKVGSASLRPVFGAITKIDYPGVSRIDKTFSRLKQPSDFPVGFAGMAYSALAAAGVPTLFDYMVQQLNLQDVFSICFDPSGTGGVLSLGGVLPHDGDIQYTPITTNTFYSVSLLDLAVNGVNLNLYPDIFGPNIITDSGTPVPTFPPSVMKYLKEFVISNCTNKPLHGICDVPSNETLFDGSCYELTQDQINSFPTINFVLNGAILDYPPSQYLQPFWVCDKPNTVTIGLQGDPSGFGSVIGLSVLQQYMNVYDRSKPAIGFGKSNCKTK